MSEPMSTVGVLRCIQQHFAAIEKDFDFGPWLRATRKAKGLTLQMLSAETGLSISYLSDIERGTRSPMGTEYASELADALGVEDHETVARLAVGRMTWREARAGEKTQTRRARR